MAPPRGIILVHAEVEPRPQGLWGWVLRGGTGGGVVGRSGDAFRRAEDARKAGHAALAELDDAARPPAPRPAGIQSA